MNPLPTFVDFEASSLSPDSFPIEVAWNDAHGVVQSHLISPQQVRSWTDWSEEAERVHGIARRTLETHGIRPATVCNLLLPMLKQGDVYSDAPPFDLEWMRKLFRAAKVGMPAVKVRDIRELKCIQALGDRWVDCQRIARTRVGGQHRANVDVRYLIELYRIAIEAKQ